MSSFFVCDYKRKDDYSMKIQGLAVIFAIIIIPISLVISTYVQSQVDTITLQTSYDTKLDNATHDAVKAFQLNEINSNTQNVDTEKIRDIEASINTFYNSLATSLGTSGFSEDELSRYIPALVYTLYDGYYIYAPFQNISNPNASFENGLKPYIYYSARYQKGSTDIVVNYTLDNYITIYGNVGGNYVTRSGYLINPDDVVVNGDQVRYKGEEIRGENLLEVNFTTYQTKTEVPYIYVDAENNQREKVYYDSSRNTWYRISIDRKRIDVKPDEAANFTVTDTSAKEYYKEAKEFSTWVKNNLGGLTLNDMTEEAKEELGINGTEKLSDHVFNVSDSNDPEEAASIFNDHRRSIIKTSIETNLAAAIAGYNSISQVNDTTYNFKMPILQEDEWDQILNNVSVISFLQGIPIKNKYYNGYSIMTNNKNREFIDPHFIYFVDKSSSENKFHNIQDVTNTTNWVGYRNLDFNRRKVVNSDEDTTEYFYPHGEEGCYDCVVSATNRILTLEDVINDTSNHNIRSTYFTAIGRERYNSYKSNKFEQYN